jgi:hypothetical protein
MRKVLLWGGLVGTIVFFAFAFLAGASNNGKALLPGIYGTSSLLWAFFAVICLILFIIGLIMVIVQGIKNRKTQ